LRTMVILVKLDENEKYEDAMVREKCMIVDGVKDHAIPHIAKKNTTKEMWDKLMISYHRTAV